MRRTLRQLLFWITRQPCRPLSCWCSNKSETDDLLPTRTRHHRSRLSCFRRKVRISVGCICLLILTLFLVALWLIPYVRFEPHPMVLISWVTGQKLPPADSVRCTMDSCFDFSKCRGNIGEFKFYLYPKDPEHMKYAYYYGGDYKSYDRAVEVFNELYGALQKHPSRTENPIEACVFFPGFDTSSWAAASNLPSYWRVSKRLRQLQFWNGNGKNHIIFDRHEHDWQPFATDYAIVVRASLHAKYYRPNFDLSYNLQPETKEGSCPVTEAERRKPPSDRPLLAFFTGRFTSKVRHNLYELYAYDEEVVVRHRDPENAHLYCGDLKRAKFGLNPRGMGLTTYRTLELLQAGVIPVYYGDNYVLPFSEVLEWKFFSVVIPEYQYYRTKEILKSFTPNEIEILQANAVHVYEKFFYNQTQEIGLLMELLKARIYKSNKVLSQKDSFLGSKYLYAIPVNII